jgi:hypothetical protein
MMGMPTLTLPDKTIVTLSVDELVEYQNKKSRPYEVVLPPPDGRIFRVRTYEELLGIFNGFAQADVSLAVAHFSNDENSEEAQDPKNVGVVGYIAPPQEPQDPE